MNTNLQSHDQLHVQPETVCQQLKSIITLSPTSAGIKQEKYYQNSQFFSLNLKKDNHKQTLKMWLTASLYMPCGVTHLRYHKNYLAAVCTAK
jgi:hypothetical protein